MSKGYRRTPIESEPAERLYERFWEKVEIREPDECWEWQAGLSGRYGAFQVGGQSHSAHRVAWVLENGPLPECFGDERDELLGRRGVCVLHACDNPPCCNPSHLFLGTQPENIADMERKRRAVHPRGEDAGNSKVTSEDILTIRELRGQARQVDIAAAFGISQAQVSKIQLEQSWRHV